MSNLRRVRGCARADRALVGCADARSGWSTLAIVGMLAGIASATPAAGLDLPGGGGSSSTSVAANPTVPPPGEPSPTPSATPTPSQPGTVTPTPTPSPAPVATTHTPGVYQPRDRSHPAGGLPVPTTGGPGIGADHRRPGIDVAWTWYLPTPEVGFKIFAGGLIGLAMAIAGLATLAFRRRRS